MNEQFSAFDEFILKKYNNLLEFSEDINSTAIEGKLFFKGEGTVLVMKDEDKLLKDYFYFLHINDSAYALVIRENDDRSKKFDGIYKYDLACLTSQDMMLAKQQNYGNAFRDFKTNIAIEVKFYDHNEEHKVLISQEGKVDLLYSIKILNNENNLQLSTQSHPSLKNVVEWQRKIDEVNRRTEEVIARKKNKQTTS